MGTRTYSRRGVNGQRVLTAEGRRRAGIEAIDILGNPVPDRPVAAPASGDASWLTNPVPELTPDTAQKLRELNTGYANGEWNNAFINALRAQKVYQINPTPETLAEMLALTGALQSNEHRMGLRQPTRAGDIDGQQRLDALRSNAASLGLVAQLPPETYQTPTDIYSTENLPQMSYEYFADYGADLGNMTVDMRAAVREIGGGSIERGIGAMQKLTAEVRKNVGDIAREGRKSAALEERITQLTKDSSNPRAASDIRASLANLAKEITSVQIMRRRGDFDGAKKLEASLIKRLGQGYEPAKGRGRQRGERIALPKMSAATVKGLIERQYERYLRTPTVSSVLSRTPGQTLGEYVKESARRLEQSSKARAYSNEINNDLREVLLNVWPAPTS